MPDQEENYVEMYVRNDSGTKPESPVENMIYENSATGKRERYINGEWVELA